MSLHRFIIIISSLATPIAAEGMIEFNKDIRPILSDHCFSCHGPDERARKADLRLDTYEGAIRDLGGYSAIVPGDPEKSELLIRTKHSDPEELMPPPKSKIPKLDSEKIGLLTQWIKEGAKYQRHWAFTPITNPKRNSKDHLIDYFISKRLNKEGMALSERADPYTLIRRLYLDLTGLLPSPEEVSAFAKDPSEKTYVNLVDTLLKSPHYGERWGRHWLDQARYADSHGYTSDSERQMWPYRDWVIDALNRDMSFDQFTIEQIAGDLLPDATKSQIAATAFHRNTLISQEGGSDPEQFRVEATMDRVNTTGAVWLGLSVGCAQCHDHKFDPISQREYYEMYAFFNSAEDRNNTGPTIPIIEGELISSSEKNEKNKANLMVMRDRKDSRETFLLTRGDFTTPDKKSGQLNPGFISAITTGLEQKEEKRSRLDLAKWLVSPKNPLTSRVTVNRTWMRYFGKGLVETEEDFGTRGTLPSHPDLLESLSSYFIDSGWSMKKLHKLIVTSKTYTQSSKVSTESLKADPGNYLLSRQSRIRLDAEIIRDAALSASGLLTRKIGGPGIRPPQPSGIYAFTQNKKQWNTTTGPDRYRRGMYIVFFRSAPYPLFGTFDVPDFQTTCTRRARSNTPLQALNISNDPAFIEFAQGLALRTIQPIPGEAHTSLDKRIKLAFKLALSRPPTDKEFETLKNYAIEFAKDMSARDGGEEAKSLINEAISKSAISLEQGATLVAVSRAILNTDNFITRE
ncbi:MAG: PSD1 and planctomycete cytochrome C domain-containing protein [Verrucomicrobiales bacterium]|nr:PSD1 and planctomycete cytochrome C domain-containing protein [Verrucomicrobiales bacterium]